MKSLARFSSALWVLFAVSAPAETIQGTFRYADRNPVDSAITLRAAAFVRVDVSSWRPRIFPPLLPPIWSWGSDGRVTTDANGHFAFNMNDVTGITYSLRVFAENYAAVVRSHDAVLPDVFSLEFSRTVGDPNAGLDISADFTNTDDSRHFNLAEAVRHGFNYANSHRDPGESDALDRVTVQPTSRLPTGTFYNPVGQILMIESAHVFEDFVIMHEYAHFLEHQLGSFLALPSSHDGCLAKIKDEVVNSSEHAWMEAFAEYYSAMVVRSLLPATPLTGTPGNGTSSVNTLEAPTTCVVPSNVTTDAIENNVAAVLWDLFDPVGTAFSAESFDQLQGLDREIFQIMDHELDIFPSFPNIHKFIDAWRRRGLPFGPLSRIVFHHLPGFGFEFLCPQNLAVAAPGLDCSIVVEYPAPILNGGLPDAAISCEPPSGASFLLGATTVNCVLRDKEGIADQCSFIVTVNGTPAPNFGGTGLLGTYYDNIDLTNPRFSRVDPAVAFDWGDQSPDPRIQADTFSVRWLGQVVPPFSGQYTFRTVSDDGVRLWVNGVLLIDNWTDHGPTEDTGAIVLTAGRPYSIVMEYYESGGGAVAGLFWSSACLPREPVPRANLFPPPEGSGLAGVYYDRADFTMALFARVDPQVDFDWAVGAPAPGVGSDTFTARWTGKVLPECSGVYTFSTVSDDGVRLWIDGKPVIDHWNDHGPFEDQGKISLIGGRLYDIQMDYYENGGGAVARLLWSGPCTPKQVIPARNLFPESSVDLGSRDIPGSVARYGNRWLMTGNGAGLFGQVEGYHFLHQPWHGDGEVIARIEEVSGTAGLLITEALTASARQVFAGVDPGAGVIFRRRTLPLGNLVQATVGAVPTGPYWLRLTRCGNVFTAYGSADGSVWKLLDRASVEMPGTVYAGLAVEAARVIGAKSPVGRAAFTDLAVRGTDGCPCLAGQGLRATYYDNTDLTAPRLTRVDAAINFDWGTGSPDPSVGSDTFSARWSGSITPRYGETYMFTTRSDDGVRLWVDGRLLIDRWNDHAPTSHSAAISLAAGRRYDLRMDYYENGGGAVASLLWSSASQPSEVVPASQLNPHSPGVPEIAELFPTGVDEAGVPLPDSHEELHWLAWPAGGAISPAVVRTASGGFPIGPWLGDNGVSAWLVPAKDAFGKPGAVHIYHRLFHLSGFEPATTLITGQFLADGGKVEVELNGRVVFETGSASFAAWTPFAITSGFQPGANALLFRVHNDGTVANPTGLRVELCGTSGAHCLDFTRLADGPVRTPWFHEGLTLTSLQANGQPSLSANIGSAGNFSGFNFGGRLEIGLPTSSVIAELRLAHFNSPATVVAYNVLGQEVSRASMTVGQNISETLILGGRGMTRLVITAPESEAMLLRLCYWPERPFVISEARLATGDQVFTFNSLGGKTYCLECRDSLKLPWRTLGCVFARSMETSITNKVGKPRPPVAFYRIVEQP